MIEIKIKVDTNSSPLCQSGIYRNQEYDMDLSGYDIDAIINIVCLDINDDVIYGFKSYGYHTKNRFLYLKFNSIVDIHLTKYVIISYFSIKEERDNKLKSILD